MAKKTRSTTRKPTAPGTAPAAQTFRFTAPDATSVMLAGDFTHWQQAAIPMQKGPGGVWQARVELPPGTHHYRFVVDGVWRDDPECTLRVTNPFGGQDCARSVT